MEKNIASRFSVSSGAAYMPHYGMYAISRHGIRKGGIRGALGRFLPQVGWRRRLKRLECPR